MKKKVRKKTKKYASKFSFPGFLKVLLILSFFSLILFSFWMVYQAKAQSIPVITYSQTFEDPAIDQAGGLANNYDWFLFNPTPQEPMAIVQKIGNNTLEASSGDYYGVVSQALSYSHFGEDCPTDSRSDIWLTQLDVYLDNSWVIGAGFDYAIELKALNPEFDDFRFAVFHVSRDISTKKLLIGASELVGDKPNQDLEADSHYEVKKDGWFTLRSKLKSVNNILVIEMAVIDESKRIVWQKDLTANDFSYDVASLSWNCKASFPVLYNGYTINDPTLPYQDSGFDLPIDNHKLVIYNETDVLGPPVNKSECENNGWKVFNWQTFDGPTFKSQGDCVSFVESSENAEGNLK